MEHWYHSLRTFSDPFSPPIFFPVRGTLGYSHSLILFAPFYVVLRLFFHPFQAYGLTLFLVIETGVLYLYLVFRRFVQLSFVDSLLLMALFLSSRNVIGGFMGTWAQTASVFLIPPGIEIRRRRESRGASVVRGEGLRTGVPLTAERP